MKKNLILTAFLGIIGILLGAFASHSLKANLTAEALDSFKVGVQYQLYHVLVLLFVNTYNGFDLKIKNRISIVFFLAILFFSGSIYLISLGHIQAKTIWYITPMGGLLFILGWIFMLISFIKPKKLVN